ncbi:MAG: hypothetical protein U9N83_12965 [Thermodesulfobacteriota bacterium]|nr:hypothetical protein [Thermodesulfobacteriota bacterium]
MGRVVDLQVFHRKGSQTSDPDKQHLLADPAVCPRHDSILRKDCTTSLKGGGDGYYPLVCRLWCSDQTEFNLNDRKQNAKNILCV